MSNKTVYSSLIAILFSLVIANSACAQNENQNVKQEKSTLEAIGKGEVKIKPDVAYLTFAVETTSRTASEAVKNNAGKMKSVIDQLKSQIGKEDKISTSGYQLSPIYEYNESTRRSELIGYQASNQALVETKNLNELGNLIDSSTQVGANRIDSISFGTDKKDEYRRQALVEAVQDAKATAEIVAKAAGVKVVKILRISPSYDTPIPVYRDFIQTKALEAGAASTPIEPGEVTVSATVNINFEIE